ncbi:hypothetical protein [Caballeronia sp. LjRoot31]|uniref:hypothetical protein n=1 Tax=Caballeronia sp. LjRoot31 TaxID=3342324 RepID=UPI003ECC4C9F
MMKLPFYRRYHLHPKPFNFIISERVAILKSSPQRRQFDLRPVTLDTTSVENAVAWLQPHRNQTTTKHQPNINQTSTREAPGCRSHAAHRGKIPACAALTLSLR